MDDIAIYHRALVERDGDSEVDERTWNDLDLDSVYAELDLTSSAVGQQVLYHRLRSPSMDTAPIADFDALVCDLQRDAATRNALGKTLERLNRAKAYYLPNLFLLPVPWRPRFRFVFPLLSLFALLSIVSVFFIRPMLVVALAAVAANIGIEMFYRRRIYEYVRPLRVLDSLIRTGRVVSERGGDVIQHRFPQLAADLARLRPLTRTTVWLALEREGMDDPLTLLWSYMNMFFLADVNAFAASFAFLDKHHDAVERVFAALGTIDAAIAIGRYRSVCGTWSRPEFVPRSKTLHATAARHPILGDTAVPNTVAIDGRGVIVTGSNMSGKTTFLRTIGVNAILAQTIATTLCEAWRAPLLRVMSSIGRGDDLAQGKSYYLAELERVGALVRASGDASVQHLFVIDEIFRGTNTIERIAASRGVLLWLNRADDITLVATHDIELIDLLRGDYEAYHFRELVEEGELRFDYRIQPGPSSTRNAIALLELLAFPPEVVEVAIRTVAGG